MGGGGGVEKLKTGREKMIWGRENSKNGREKITMVVVVVLSSTGSSSIRFIRLCTLAIITSYYCN